MLAFTNKLKQSIKLSKQKRKRMTVEKRERKTKRKRIATKSLRERMTTMSESSLPREKNTSSFRLENSRLLRFSFAEPSLNSALRRKKKNASSEVASLKLARVASSKDESSKARSDEVEKRRRSERRREVQWKRHAVIECSDCDRHDVSTINSVSLYQAGSLSSIPEAYF